MKLIKILIPVFVCFLSLFVLLSGTQSVYAYETIRVNIPVDCLEVYGNNTHTYELKIESENKNSPMSVNDTLTIAEDCSGAFEIELTEPGTYYYGIYEVAGSDTNIQYDSSSYDVVVYAENGQDGSLCYTITAYKAGGDRKAESIVFQDNILAAAKAAAAAETTTVDGTTPPAATVTAADTTSAGTDTTSANTDTTAATAGTAKGNNTDFIRNILTGDSFPAHAIRLVMLISAMTAIFAFLFKRDQSEEDEKNE